MKIEVKEEIEDVKPPLPPVRIAQSDCEVKLERKWQAMQKMGANYVRGKAVLLLLLSLTRYVRMARRKCEN